MDEKRRIATFYLSLELKFIEWKGLNLFANQLLQSLKQLS
jgi:hypothetical protein